MQERDCPSLGQFIEADVTARVPDDRKHARDALEAVPKSVGAHVVPCASGDKALPGPRGLPTAQRPAVLLGDIVFGGEQDGYDFLRLISEEEASRAATLMECLPAIALTSHAQADARPRAQAAGFPAHLTEPVPTPKLIATIEGVTSRAV
ncbi:MULTISPECIES: hypothetical protein [Caballeronia]|uniref:hypothetical protein n=1 Tax=Caballeronia TaxID=1827195 RepID=UPI00045EFFC6|nr:MULTISPECIES: hypothetical protein [unclassified Caballeronia]MCE4547468.1 hypothetical protein [Caballeronia sp. PC1]MCE4575454.1 hypothetical protein [Caballeronia sp. CLC5]BAO92604.1 response regulator receiver protein [Burkholderia sp. RPE67]